MFSEYYELLKSKIEKILLIGYYYLSNKEEFGLNNIKSIFHATYCLM